MKESTARKQGTDEASARRKNRRDHGRLFRARRFSGSIAALASGRVLVSGLGIVCRIQSLRPGVFPLLFFRLWREGLGSDGLVCSPLCVRMWMTLVFRIFLCEGKSGGRRA